MKKGLIKIVCITTVILLMISVFAGCSNRSEKNAAEGFAGDEKYGGKPVTLEVYWNYDNLEPVPKWGSDPVSAEILRRTGVTIERNSPVNEPERKLNIMIASGDMPDMIWSDLGDIVDKMISSKIIIPLDNLIIEHAPELSSSVPQNIFKALTYNDGKLYYLPNSFRNEVSNGASVQIRRDIYTALGSPKINTTDDYYNLIKSIKGKGFKSLDGKDVLPYGMWSEGLNIGTLGGFWGIKSYYEMAISEDEESIVSFYRHPKMIEALKFVNRLYREGLADEELFTQKQFQVDEKFNNGRYAVTNLWAFQTLDAANNSLKRNAMEDSEYIVIDTPKADGVQKATMCAEFRSGWNVAMITKSCEHPDRAIQLANFLIGEEGQMLTIYGIKDKHYTVNDGQIKRDQAVIDGFLNSGDVQGYKQKTGIDLYAWLKSLDIENKNQELHSEQYQKNWGISKYNAWDATAIAGINPSSTSDENKILRKGYTIFWTKYYPKIILEAKSDSEAEALYNQMNAELKAAGIEKLEEFWTKAYRERKEKLGL